MRFYRKEDVSERHAFPTILHPSHGFTISDGLYRSIVGFDRSICLVHRGSGSGTLQNCLGETGYWSTGQRLSDSSPSQGYSTLDDSSVPEYLVCSSPLLFPVHPPLTLGPFSPDSVVAPNDEPGRRPLSGAADEPTALLKRVHRITLVLRPLRSASLD